MRFPIFGFSDVVQQRTLAGLAVRYEPYAVSQNFTFTPQDEIDSLQVDAASANITVTLPSPTGNRRRRVIKTDSSANTVTVVGTINGVSNYTLASQYDRVEVEPTGTAWLIIN